jgi:hypothetical protein
MAYEMGGVCWPDGQELRGMSCGGGGIRWQRRIPAAPRKDSGDADGACRRRWDDEVQVQTVSANHMGVEIVTMSVSRDLGV